MLCLRNTEDLWEDINARRKKQSQSLVQITVAIGSKKAADTIYSLGGKDDDSDIGEEDLFGSQDPMATSL